MEIFWLTESNLQLLPHIIKNDCTTTTRLFFLYFLIQVKTGIMMNFFEVLLLIKDTTKRIKLWIWCVHYFPNCRKKLWKRWKGNASVHSENFKHEYLRSRASICLSLSSPCHLLAIYRLSRYTCLYLGSLHPRILNLALVVSNASLAL